MRAMCCTPESEPVRAHGNTQQLDTHVPYTTSPWQTSLFLTGPKMRPRGSVQKQEAKSHKLKVRLCDLGFRILFHLELL